MIYSAKLLAQLVVEKCAQHNITTVIVSPGSRNAPLTIGFTNNNKIKALSIVDERCAAFFALGIAQQTNNPVAVVCTSGSALLNYYPAIAEAFYSHIPLVIISADRPKHMIDIADGQTIRQENVFANHILFNANLVDAVNELRHNALEIDKALNISISKKGPVHINVPFDEPLYETTNKLMINDYLGDKVRDKQNNSLLAETPLNVNELEKFANTWNKSIKKMVLIGVHAPDELLTTQLEHLVKDESVLVLTETTSNIGLLKSINNIDQLIIPLTIAELSELQPDILVTIGGMVVSKKIKQFLREFKPTHHWHVSTLNAPNTYYCLSHHFKISPQLFFSQFFFLTKALNSNYQNYWLAYKQKRKNKHQQYLKAIGFSDLKAMESVFNAIPNNYQLQLSNSTVIRYSQLFDINPTLKIFCNRGTSGIDGSTSTAIGAAFSSKNPTVFITGDLSFFYDSNALWNKYIPKNFKIILINNSGGGIFKFIPGPTSTNSLNYFVAPHHLNATHYCKMYGFNYVYASSLKDLDNKLVPFFNNDINPTLLEINTSDALNDEILKAYFNMLG